MTRIARLALGAALALGCDACDACDSAPPSAATSAPSAQSSAPRGDAPSAPTTSRTDASRIDAAVAIVSHDASCAPAAPALVCAGTLIEPDIVLTAAHCLGRGPPSSLDVMVGLGASHGGARARVLTGAAHPGFERGTFAHDVAVLVLARPLPAAPIPLRRAPIAADAAAATLEAVGYGGSPGDPVDAIRQRRGLLRLGAVEDQRLKLLPGPSMTCRGDSGGPILLRDGGKIELVGVTTHGDPACRETGFAARVDQSLAFIDAQIAAARSPSPPRRPFDPNEDLCRAACSKDDDCPAGLACIAAERRCSFEGLPPARFAAPCADACPGDQACVRVSDAQCRCLDPCTPTEAEEPPARPSAPAAPAVTTWRAR